MSVCVCVYGGWVGVCMLVYNFGSLCSPTFFEEFEVQ